MVSRKILLLLPALFFIQSVNAQLGKSDLGRGVNRLHDLLNERREKAGLPEFKNEKPLAEAALAHASYLIKAKDLTHDEKAARRRTPEERVKSSGGEFRLVTELLYEIESRERKLSRREMLSILPAAVEKWAAKEPGIFTAKYDYAGIALTYDSKRDVVFCVLLLARK
jgi:uncharacterized protein YkwD